MLTGLSIRDLVLIERLDLHLRPGLAVLTGETGAGKSILLDALGLALGARAEGRLVRQGAAQAQVTASFEVEEDHPAWRLAAEQGLGEEAGVLLLRRQVTAEGRSRAFVNDQPVSAAMLRSLGDLVAEIQGQFEQRGLLDARNHMALLDAYGHLEAQQQEVANLHAAWNAAGETAAEAARARSEAQAEEETLRHALEELEALAPEPGEVDRLAHERQALLHRGAILEALQEAERSLYGGGRAEGLIAQALRGLERVAEKAGERLLPATEALERALSEVEEAGRAIAGLSADIEAEPDRLERLDERFFALKDLARKHAVEADGLPALQRSIAGRLEALEGGEAEVKRLEATAAAARTAFREAAHALGSARRRAAVRLDEAVTAELPPLRLERALFRTEIADLAEDDWGPRGAERAQFLVATNPGAAPGPIGKIASGGELARFLLAIRVVLARLGAAETLVFDEVDAGIGGATAAAVGERLARLARDRQVLVVTHSPQVAARGDQHLQVNKAETAGTARTAVTVLADEARREEIARMLAGAEVTVEARQAAAKLLERAR